MKDTNQNLSIVHEIWKDQALYIGFAIKDLMRTHAEAVDLLNDVVVSLLKNNTFDPKRSKLNYFIKLRMRSRHKDIVEKQTNDKNAQAINIDSKFSVTPDQFLNDLPLNEKEFMTNLIDNPLKTHGNYKDQIIITTNKPHKALVGYAIKIRGLTNINELSIKRLSNFFGDEIYISDILDENNLIVKVNFDHDITPASCGGNKAQIVIKRVNNTFQTSNTKKRLSEGDEDKVAIDNIEIKEGQKFCLGKFKPAEKFIFLANMSKIKGRNLGEKKSDPKFDNDGNPLKIGDVYIQPLPLSEATRDEQYTFKCFNGKRWESTNENPAFNKPMTTERIKFLYNAKFNANLSLSRIGEIVAHVKKSFAECMKNMRPANG
ncbi:hypothetical protein OAM56_05910 [Alphaproteobacteria bacterium]|nr:hypothetical protein [Alphaproteobacteria bacterium]